MNGRMQAADKVFRDQQLEDTTLHHSSDHRKHSIHDSGTPHQHGPLYNIIPKILPCLVCQAPFADTARTRHRRNGRIYFRGPCRTACPHFATNIAKLAQSAQRPSGQPSRLLTFLTGNNIAISAAGFLRDMESNPRITWAPYRPSEAVVRSPGAHLSLSNNKSNKLSSMQLGPSWPSPRVPIVSHPALLV